MGCRLLFSILLVCLLVQKCPCEAQPPDRAYLTQDDFVCNYQAVQQNAEMFKNLEAVEQILVKQTTPPKYFEATNVPGASPYLYNGFLIRPVYFEGLPYRGNCTLVFAWLSAPLHSKESVPGTVLIHGGGGTALKEWCEKWATHRMASIAIGTEGQTDAPGPRAGGYQTTPYPGPTRPGAYADHALPIRKQWMFHAVTQSILANTLLRAQPHVFADHVGVAGVSWGGVITSTMLTLDYDRLAFAIPGYGCGSLEKRDSAIGNQMRNYHSTEFYQRIWDPTNRLARLFKLGIDSTRIPPTLWLSGPHETNFPIEHQRETYDILLQNGAHVMVTLIPHLGHSHGTIWRRPESYAFVKSVLKSRQEKLDKMEVPQGAVVKGSPFVTQIDQFVVSDDKSHRHGLAFKSFIGFKEATLVYTCQRHDVPLFKKKWFVEPMRKLHNLGCEEDSSCIWLASFDAPLNFDRCSWYVNLVTDNDLVVSSTLNYW